MYTFSQGKVKIGEEEITELHHSGKNNRKECLLHLFQGPSCDSVDLADKFLNNDSSVQSLTQPLPPIRSCSGFLGVLHVCPGPHILWPESPSPDVSGNPAVHNPTYKPQQRDLRLVS